MENENQTQSVSKKLLAFNAILALTIAGLGFLIYADTHIQAGAVSDEDEKPMAGAFADVDLEAKAAYVIDLSNNRVIYKKNETTQLPLASLTKLMTALVATEIVPPYIHITVKPEFLREEGDSGLLADESWRLRDLLDLSLVASSNDGARSIASVIGADILKTDNLDLGRQEFISKMNDRAKELGLSGTYFLNESGLDISSSTSGGYGSAKDVATLLSYILKHHSDILEATRLPTATIQSLSGSHTVTNTDKIVGNIPGLLASKTGYTNLAGGNLAIAFDASIARPIIIVVLGSSQEGRFTDVSNLISRSMTYVQSE